MSLPTTTDAAFAAVVLAAELPVLVDFTADWCPPCKMIKPVLERIATEEAGRLRVVTLDVDENPRAPPPAATETPGAPRRYGVMGMPTLGLFIGGELVTSLVGARPQPAILKALEPYLPVSVRGACAGPGRRGVSRAWTSPK